MKKIWKEHLDAVNAYKPGKPIAEVERELGIEKVIKLASNENPLPPSRKVIEAITSRAGEVNRYPDGGCYYLRKALSEKLGIPGEKLIFGNGSDEIILITLKALIDPGDEVIVADPTFLIYHIASMIKGAAVKVVPSKGYKYDLEGMLAAITDKTKVIFIANPDNPTGTYVAKDELEAFIEKVPAHVLVFLDEAYYEFATGEDYPETLGMIDRKGTNIIVARTFSKAYSLAGLRIGYGVASADIAEVLNKIREPFNVNSLAQAAALAALGDEEYMLKAVKIVKDEKKRYYDFFDSFGVKYIESKTNFILVNVGIDSTELFEELLKRGVIVRDMSAWGIAQHIRVNMGLKEENDRFFEAFKDAIDKIKK